MKKMKGIGAVVGVLLCAVVAVGAVRYENPVVKADFPDPTVWRGEDGIYYAASTHQDVLKSRDLVHWEDTGHRLLEDAEYAWIAKSWPHVWAPDVVKVGDWYNLYITFHNTGAHTAIACYRSKDPAGPFTDREIVIRSEGNGRFEVIDAEVVRDPKDGRMWLFFGHGDVRRVELTDDGRAQKPGAKVVHVAGIALDAPRPKPDDPRFLSRSCEGAYLYYRNGRWYLFCSIGDWGGHTYRVIVGRSDTIDGEFTDREGRRMSEGYGTVILMSDKGEEFFGPGHNGEIFASPSGRTYMFYHCHWTGLMKIKGDDANMKVGGTYIPRPLFLQEILWDEDGWPHFGNGGKPQKDCELVYKVPKAEMLARVPEVVMESEPEFTEFTKFAWTLAYDHVTNCTGAAQSPYMDEAFYADRIWMWDSCFMVNYCKYAPQLFPGVESLANFYAPMLEGARTPLSIHIPDNPPLFAWVEWMYYRQTGDKARLDRVFREKRYPQRMFELFENFKTGDVMPYQTSAFPVMWEKRDLGYVWTGGRSGMDNTPRGDFPSAVMDNDARYLTIYWIDAIAQQALAARIIYGVTGEMVWKERFETLAKTINDHYWDEADGCYYDIRSYAPHDKVKVMTPASYWPLLAGVVPSDRAKRLVSHLENAVELGGPVPFPSVARNSRHFNKDGAYWRGGVWLPTAFMCVQALEENGFGELADRLGEQIVRWQFETYRKVEPHTIWEAYSPTEPKPATGKFLPRAPNEKEGARPDFCGWSALGPINMMIENVLGIRCDGVTKTVTWRLHRADRHGVKRLRFGDVTADLVYADGKIETTASAPFTLVVNGLRFAVASGCEILEIGEKARRK